MKFPNSPLSTSQKASGEGLRKKPKTVNETQQVLGDSKREMHEGGKSYNGVSSVQTW